MKRLTFILFLYIFCPGLKGQDLYQVYDTIRIQHHNLYLDLTDLEGHTLKGKAILDVESKMGSLSHVPLQLLYLSVDSVWVNGLKVEKGLSYNGILLRVPLFEPLEKNGKVRITVAYHGTPVSERFGGVVFNEKERMVHNMGVSISSIPHSYGKSIYPCVDDFRAKSTYEMHVRCAADLMAVCNGLMTSSRMMEDGSAVFDWRLGQMIPDYLVNFAVGPYQKIHMEYERAEGVLPMDIYCLEQEKSEAQACYSVLPDILRVLEARFGAFCFDRVGFVSVNSPGGAMEHATNISMPRNPRPTFAYRQLFIHELIHSWFGNRVTCETPEDMWLNEGLTSWAVETVLEELFPDDLASYWQSELYSALHAPLREGGFRALTGMPQEYTYSNTVYDKGAWVMRTLRSYIGDDTRFFNAIKQYVQDYTFQNASTKDFKESMEQSLGRSLETFFQNLVDGTGFDVLSTSLDQVRKSKQGYEVQIRLDTKRIGIGPSIKDTWKIPVLLIGKKGEKVLLPIAFDFASERLVTTIQAPFKPVTTVVDPEGKVLKAQTLDHVHLGAQDSIASRYTYLTFRQEKPEEAEIYAEYLMAPPEGMEATYYWRLSGSNPKKTTVDFQINRIKDAGLYQKKAGKVRLWYRKDQQKPWTCIQTSDVDLTQRNVSISAPWKKGEYTLSE